MLLITNNISRVMMKMILEVSKRKVKSHPHPMISSQEEAAEVQILKYNLLPKRDLADQDVRCLVKMREVMMKRTWMRTLMTAQETRRGNGKIDATFASELAAYSAAMAVHR